MLDTFPQIEVQNVWLSGRALRAKSMGNLICLMLMKRTTKQGFCHQRHTFYAITFQKVQSQFYHFWKKKSTNPRQAHSVKFTL